MQGAWIEIVHNLETGKLELSLPVQGAWIEISCAASASVNPPSLPVQGAWIEMFCPFLNKTLYAVAPRAGSVD